MFLRDDEFVAPEYTPALSGEIDDHIKFCSFCGAGVLNQLLHDEWHAQLWVALKKEK